MKKKFGLFALVLTVLLCGSLFLFAACGDGEEEEPSATPAISVTVNETARQSGATIEGDTEDTYTIAASVVNGEEGASVTISYVYESGEAEDFSGSTFSPDEAGTYVFTFTAEGASNFTLTFEIAEAQAPAHEHTYGTWNVTAPTADTAGQAVRTCDGCEESEEGHTQTIALPALNSTEAETAYTSSVKTPATCTVAEVTTYTYTEDDTITFDITGKVSDEQSAHGTSLSFFDAKAATCTEAGEIAYAHCTACGKYYNVAGDASNFTIGNEITDIENGLTDTANPATGHTYEWSIKTGDEPFIGETGTATGVCSCGDITTRELPAMTDDNASQDVTTPTVGKYSFNFTQQGTCTQPTIAEITYKFEDGVTVMFTLEQPPFGHSYSKVEVEYDSATMDTTWSAKAYCDRGCGTFEEVANIPAVDIADDGTWVRDEGGNYTAPTCGESGSGTYYYSGLELSDGTPIKVFVTNVPIPATGDHSYGKPEYSDNTVTVICEVCETASVSATVTIVGGDDATGTTEFGSDAFSFADGTFTVTLPQNSFEKEGFSFSGWLVGEETKQAGASATVAENGTLVITAQWTEVTTPTISARADKTEIYAGEQITLTWSLTGGEGEVTVTYTKDDVSAGTLKPVSGEAFAINEAGVYVFTFTATDAETVTVTVTVKEKPVISLTVDGDSMENGGTFPINICIGTQISYEATVSGDGTVSASYKVDDGEAVSIEENGSFTFAEVGTYVFAITSDGADPFTYTVTVVEHTYGDATVESASGNIVQVCSVCTDVKVLAELTALQVTVADADRVFIIGDVKRDYFDIAYTYSTNVDTYAGIIEAAITENLAEAEAQSSVGSFKVEFKLGDQTASVDIMIYMDAVGGVGVLQEKEGSVTAEMNKGYDVAAIPNASANGFAVSFWMTGNTNTDWTAIVIGGKGSITGFDITLPNLDPYDYGNGWDTNAFPTLEGVNALYNGAVYSDMLRTPSFVTVSVDGVNGVSYYLNGVLQVRYETTDALANGKLVSEFVTILTGGAVTDGIQFAFGLVTQDLYVTNGLTDAQALAIFEAYKASELYPFVALNTEALLNGISGVTVFESTDASFDTDAIYRLSAIENVATTGLSVSFNLPAVVADEWAAIVIGTNIDIDVTLACLDAFGNTSGTIPSSNSAPATEQAQYFKGAYGWVTVTLETNGDITFYCNGTQVAQIAGSAYVYDFTIEAASTSVTVADVITVIFNEVATDGCDLLQAVAADDLLVTSALDAVAARTLSDNYASLNA